MGVFECTSIQMQFKYKMRNIWNSNSIIIVNFNITNKNNNNNTNNVIIVMKVEQ